MVKYSNLLFLVYCKYVVFRNEERSVVTTNSSQKTIQEKAKNFKKFPPTFFGKRRFESLEETATNTILINVNKMGILFIWNFYIAASQMNWVVMASTVSLILKAAGSFPFHFYLTKLGNLRTSNLSKVKKKLLSFCGSKQWLRGPFK